MATAVLKWIDGVLTDTNIASYSTPGPDELHDQLKDGIILCRLMNSLEPESIKNVNKGKAAFAMMENIGNFLAACERYGVSKKDLFQTVDLYDNHNMARVVNGIMALSRTAAKHSDVQGIGPNEANENKREFTDEQLKAGQNVIGLQMGTNKGSSQSGSTPYGLGRQIEKTNLST
ncbi:muscle-specific protein 20-like [Antedon mediterranea]|uniref:muscle-specific protein 20-like n=1 Tax=Antedon mediterranea TaxID=105859 RepID=UPI003AF94861